MPQNLTNTIPSWNVRDDFKFIFISIASSMDKNITIPDHPNLIDVLYLKFDDISYNDDTTFADYGNVPTVNFNESIADQIVEFYLKYESEITDVMVNCQAGISRSVGICMALNEMVNDGNKKYIEAYGPTGNRHPNLLVKDLIIKSYKKMKNMPK